ncbi:sugar ABC transporter permease [Enterococcus lemanii]|uniref:ABC transporter permease subunit n=1 Tax=Enterococcus lemanii TaxID=1159752 RepID=A0ABV9MSR8_9ENTE|nr:sugar ABC transporter permease [Enterococcus lemanii]MBM7709899.1 arabinogalactan oligomer/maltooligosaccharide transport system permease protein [Enterococcus lemanii]NLM65702.1 sugar ABC transporter permease [Enterococcus sp.]
MESTVNTKTTQAKKALLLSIIPGMGQLYNRQKLKGLLFLTITALYFIVFADLFNMGIWGLVTLGTEVPRDNSIFLLAEGLIALIVIVFGLFFYYLNLRDAYKNGELLDQGLKVNSLKESYHALLTEGYPYLLSSPAFFLLVFSVIFPILFSIALAFTNYDLYHSAPANLANWVGLETFKKIFTVDIWRATFFNVLGWTVIWTLVASTLQVSLGIFLAVVVHQKKLRFKKFFRTILVLPWAVPGFVTILIFAGMFNDSFGAINQSILSFFHIAPIPWMTDANWTRLALLMIQGWLGFPYIFIVTTGTLQSIPEDLYEASTIDGATAIQQFRKITLPLLLYSMAPIIITQFTFNFNNFNIIYLFNAGGPAVPGSTAGGTDILVSWIYKLTMQNSQYALAAALTILLSIFVIGIALWQFKRTNSFKEEV